MEVKGWWRWWPGLGRPSALEREGGEGEGDMAGSTALVSIGGRVVVVVMRWPGPSAVERKSGGCGRTGSLTRAGKEASWPGLSTIVERGEVVVVMRGSGPYALKREGGGRRVAESQHWRGKVGGGGGGEAAGSLRARAGGWGVTR